jgi:hypothetical protein
LVSFKVSSMLKPIYALLLTIVIGAGMVAWRINLESEDESLRGHEPASSGSVTKTVRHTTSGIAEVIPQGAEDDFSQEVNEELGWSEVQEAPTKLGSYLIGLEDQRFLKLNRSRLEALQVGDTLELWMPQESQVLEVVIIRRIVTDSGNTVMNGNLDGDENYPFVMTIGQTSTFATISTREAVYSLQGDTELAWVASSVALKQYFPQKQNDYVIPNNF